MAPINRSAYGLAWCTNCTPFKPGRKALLHDSSSVPSVAWTAVRTDRLESAVGAVGDKISIREPLEELIWVFGEECSESLTPVVVHRRLDRRKRVANSSVCESRMRRAAAMAGESSGDLPGRLSRRTPMCTIAIWMALYTSGRLTPVEMVQGAHLREFDHSPLFWNLQLTRNRAVRAVQDGQLVPQCEVLHE